MADTKKKAVKKVQNKVKSKAKSKVKSKAKKAGKSVLPQILPVILLLCAVFLLVCFVLNLIFNPGNELKGSEGEHPMGPLGFYICEFFFGFFGIMALLLPIALAFFSMFWKRLDDAGIAVRKTVMASVTLVLTTAFIHILLTLISGDDLSTDFSELYELGATLTGGGVIGGYLGYLFYLLLNLGSVFVLAIAIGVLGCYLFGLPLHLYIAKLGDLIKEKWDKRGTNKKPKSVKAPKKSKYDDDDEDYDEEDEIPVKPVKLKAPQKETAPNEKSARPENGKAQRPSAVRNDEKLIVDGDDEDFKSDKPTRTEKPMRSEKSARVRAFGDDSAKRQERPKSEPAGKIVDPDDEINFDAFDDSDFEDEIKINGKKPIIDKETGEVIFDESEEEMPDETDDLILTDDMDEPAETVREYKFPPIDILKKGSLAPATSEAEIESNKQVLREVLESFKIKVREITCSCGPTITRYEIKPDAGVRVRAIANLVDDIAMALATPGVRIEAPIPGKAAVGVEVPNAKRGMVLLRSILETPEFQNHKSKLAACLGTDVSGKPIVFDIEKMPHLLVAGTTGSGKSVCINTIIASLLYRTKPDEVKLVLVDPKKVEFNVYRDIPHLSCRIVTDPKKAAGALNSAVNEMEKRFELIEEVGVRNITGYNEATKNDPDKPYMPRMVIIIDELADLMMTVSDEVETAICRIAQKARAAGIHLILGTQRPSTDVITGLMKANIPSRIAFTVASQVDSRVILDNIGAEKLTGMGDMLFAPVGSPKPMRVQGTFVSDAEIESVIEYIKANNAPVRYDSEFEKSIDEEAAKCGNPASKKSGADEVKLSSGDEDPKLYEAVELAVEAGKISTSLLQRKLEIGYGRAAKIIDRMEELGYVGPADGNKPRKILITADELAEKQINDNDDAGIFD